MEKWIEDAFDKADMDIKSMDERKALFLLRLPTMMDAYAAACGKKAATEVMAAMMASPHMTRFVSLAFAAGYMEKEEENIRDRHEKGI